MKNMLSIVMLMVWISGATCSATELTVNLKETAVVGSAKVLLRDLAELSSADTPRLRAAELMEVGTLDLIHPSASFESASLRARLVLAGWKRSELTFIGAPEVHVWLREQTRPVPAIDEHDAYQVLCQIADVYVDRNRRNGVVGMGFSDHDPLKTVFTGLTPLDGVHSRREIRATAPYKGFIQGPLEWTGNTLDISIEGKGFFPVQTPSGEICYTRNGNFWVDSQGRIVHANGHLLVPNLAIPAQCDYDEIRISVDGTLTGILCGTDRYPTNLGQLQLAKFRNPGALISVASNLYAASEESGAAQLSNPGALGYGTLRSGYLEISYADVLADLISVIRAERAAQPRGP